MAVAQHICGQRDQFADYTPYPPETQLVRGFNGASEYAAGYGQIKLITRLPDGRQNSIVLSKVIHMPGSYNLISQSSIMDRGVKVECVNHYGMNLYNRNGTMVATALQVRGLFLLDLVQPNTTPAATVSIDSDPDAVSMIALKTTGHATARGSSQIMLWHRRLAHVGLTALSRLTEVASNVPSTFRGGCECDTCVRCNLNRKPFSPTTSRTSTPLKLVHSDVCGPLERAIGGGRYMLLFVDDATRKTDGYILNNKSEALSRFKEWRALVEKETGRQIKRIRTDGGGEYTSNAFATYLAKEGIVKETTTPYTPQSNGVVERANRTIMQCVRSMLDDAGLSKQYWALAVQAAIYIKNRTPTRSVVKMTPYEAWTGRKPSLGHFRVFGCLAFVHIPEERRKKLDYRAVPGIFVGYCTTNKQYLVYDPINRKLIRSRDVVFREDKQYTAPTAYDDKIVKNHVYYREAIGEQDPTKPAQDAVPSTATSTPEAVPSTATATPDVAPDATTATPSPQPAKQKMPRELAGLDSHLGQAWSTPADGHRRTRLPATVSLAEDDNEYNNEHIPIYAAMATNTGSESQYSDGIADPNVRF